MSHASESIDVHIGGAVAAAGHHALPARATLRQAIDIAGGLAASTAGMRPSGVITVRRPRSEGRVDVFQFAMTDVPAEWESLPLQSGDLVVVQWDVETAKA